MARFISGRGHLNGIQVVMKQDPYFNYDKLLCKNFPESALLLLPLIVLIAMTHHCCVRIHDALVLSSLS